MYFSKKSDMNVLFDKYSNTISVGMKEKHTMDLNHMVS